MIADQDLFDFLDAVDEAIEQSGQEPVDIEEAVMRIRNLAYELTQPFYQCVACGRLFSTNDEYAQTSPFDGKSVLSSALGENWKRPLIGDWRDSREGPIKGYLWCQGTTSEQTYEFDQYELLEEHYWRLFHELSGKNTLRSALLKKNYTEIHIWPSE
ncbi:hypothetical protein [Paenibacillus sp. CAA11]|uniref:hypothetical protein n=1 Tax=Paenibacillus sp. CAA11 TaxID=1532905 RepID=UPI001F43FA36|nr:hypothetical protein [Paenibacillus sp. CAA11]